MSSMVGRPALRLISLHRSSIMRHFTTSPSCWDKEKKMRDKKYVTPTEPAADDKALAERKPAPVPEPLPHEEELPPTVIVSPKLYEKLGDIERETNYIERNAEIPHDQVEPRDIVSAERKWFNDEEKNKEVFLDKVEQFSETVTKRTHGQVEFIYAALRILKDYGVHKDLQAYKALMDIFPKRIMQPTNVMQIMFFAFHKQQACGVEILHKMEMEGVEPDHEIEQLVIDIFSKNSLPWRKVARQLYWFSKFRNANPFPLPEGDISNRDAIDLAKMALRRMCPDIQTRISVYSTSQIADSIDKTWIVSAQSPIQKELIEEISPDQPLYVEGAFRVWLKDQQIMFHYLRADNRDKLNPMRKIDKDPLDVSDIKYNLYGSTASPDDVLMTQKGVHKQDDGTILAIAATGTSSRDSLLSWVRILQTANPKMDHLNVIFTLKAPPVDLEPVNQMQRENV